MNKLSEYMERSFNTKMAFLKQGEQDMPGSVPTQEPPGAFSDYMGALKNTYLDLLNNSPRRRAVRAIGNSLGISSLEPPDEHIRNFLWNYVAKAPVHAGNFVIEHGGNLINTIPTTINSVFGTDLNNTWVNPYDNAEEIRGKGPRENSTVQLGEKGTERLKDMAKNHAFYSYEGKPLTMKGRKLVDQIIAEENMNPGTTARPGSLRARLAKENTLDNRKYFLKDYGLAPEAINIIVNRGLKPKPDPGPSKGYIGIRDGVMGRPVKADADVGQVKVKTPGDPKDPVQRLKDNGLISKQEEKKDSDK